ncbi:hypothetical protein [Fusibacter sp. 3D3]|uniref:hypothetical protein n=1 Tax=Fusibacter sp. 3D3 TaxID=1048380 RepID=UPI000853C711|nr:hypothetical protein [Fusibacter sp. 3D3]GAU76378.1 hypothetical protein F3D3_0975 [Fusibacter sp. 3D3]
MGRKLVSVAISLLIILNIGMSFGFETKQTPLISADELIIGEPLSDVLYANKSVFLNVNISVKAKTSVQEHPLTLSLVKLEDKLPFADALDKNLNVPIIKLSSSALLKESPSALYIVADTGLKNQENSADYKVETEIINNYFQSVEKLEALKAEITSASKKYKLESLTEAGLIKASDEVKKAYKTWTSNKVALSEKLKAFEQIQAAYLSLFEVELYKDQIAKPSYLKEVGKLEIGKYKLRFMDENNIFIKEMVFEVVKEDDTLKMISPTISVNDNTAK